MRIFLYEFVTGGGWYGHSPDPPPASLLAEGQAMLSAVAADLVAAGCTVDVTRDVRRLGFELPGCCVHQVAYARDEWRTFERLAAVADWSLIIAPEIDGQLHRRCLAVEQGGGRLLGSGSRIVQIAGDKHATAEHLACHGVRSPRGMALEPFAPLPKDFGFPAVLKRRDGAGSLGTEFLARSTSEFLARRTSRTPWAARLEAFCPGLPASVAVLCGPRRVEPLAPCWQTLGAEPAFSYLGGSLPIPPPLAERATALAARAIATLEKPLGYLGVDLVLGDDSSGLGDTVIEINPRLTTSYVGLRALLDGNLAASMLAIAAGQPAELCWKSEQVAFDASGTVRRVPGGSSPIANDGATTDRSART